MKLNTITKELSKILSPLETEIIKVLSKNKTYRVNEIYKILKRKNKVAKSSVSVLLERLYEKGLFSMSLFSSIHITILLIDFYFQLLFLYILQKIQTRYSLYYFFLNIR